MSCDRWIPLVLRAADERLDELETAEHERLEEHLATCRHCRQAMADQRAVAAAVRRRVDAPLPAGFAARVVSRLDTARGWVDLLRWQTWTYRLVPVAAALVVLAFAATPERPAAAPSAALPELAESWAFDLEATGTLPAFALLGQDDVGGDVLLDVILSTEPDELLGQGDAS